MWKYKYIVIVTYVKADLVSIDEEGANIQLRGITKCEEYENYHSCENKDKRRMMFVIIFLKMNILAKWRECIKKTKFEFLY